MRDKLRKADGNQCYRFETRKADTVEHAALAIAEISGGESDG